MLPRWHILLGAIFTFVIWILFPNLNYIYLILIFLSSVFIDLDHYINAVRRNRSFNLLEAFKYYDGVCARQRYEKSRGIRKKEEDFQFLHPIEIHLVVFLLGFLWIGFFYIFIGMLFHSILDVVNLYRDDSLYLREYSLINWARSKIKRS